MIDKLCVQTPSGSYEVLVGESERIVFDKSYSKVLIVSDGRVAPLYLEKIRAKIAHDEVYSCVIESSEEGKNFATAQEILERAFDFKLDRKSLMVALGGGVISDLVGFVSGIYQRGIDFVNIPTTLLAQVDASVGGKCGINTKQGKNLIGLFHQPSKVYAMPSFLQSLGARQIASGIAEMIKIASCFDGEFFEFLDSHDLREGGVMQSAIARSIALKASVVARDEREEGVRAGLNYGHTFGHVIELESRFGILHGEAVAIGMRMANALAKRLGLLSEAESLRIDALLKRYHLLIEYPLQDVGLFYERLFSDKKAAFGSLRFVLPQGIGSMQIVENIPKDLLFEVLGDFA